MRGRRRPSLVRQRVRLATWLRLLDWWSTGPVGFERVPVPAIEPHLLREVDERAFDGYHGQYDNGFGRAGYVVLASATRSLVGYALFMPALESEDWCLDTVAVVPERQGEGLGTALVIESARWMRHLGVPRVSATALVGQDRHRRELWLRRLGFIDAERMSLSATLDDLLGVAQPAISPKDAPR